MFCFRYVFVLASYSYRKIPVFLDKSWNATFPRSPLIVSTPGSSYFSVFLLLFPPKETPADFETDNEANYFVYPYKAFGLSWRLWPLFRTVPMLSNMFSHPQREPYYTASYTAKRERGVLSYVWEQGERPFLPLGIVDGWYGRLHWNKDCIAGLCSFCSTCTTLL